MCSAALWRSGVCNIVRKGEGEDPCLPQTLPQPLPSVHNYALWMLVLAGDATVWRTPAEGFLVLQSWKET